MRAAQPHAGLPFVPPPVADELLGAWLLRIADFYGLSLRTLLTRVGALKSQDPPRQSWFVMHGKVLHWPSLSTALWRPQATIEAMAPPSCRPWPPELGLCAKCMVDAINSGRPTTWLRCWMHPLATVCETHGSWLLPVTSEALRGVPHARGLNHLVERLLDQPEPAVAERALFEGALWLQRFFVPAVPPPDWCDASRPLLGQVVFGLGRLMTATCAVDYVRQNAAQANVDAHAIPGKWPLVIQYLDDPLGGKADYFDLPKRLRPRQQVLGLIGRLLSTPPHERTGLAISPSMVQNLMHTPCHDWPRHTLAWVSPEAADRAEQIASARRTRFQFDDSWP